jgi:hypothetical protein
VKPYQMKPDLGLSWHRLGQNLWLPRNLADQESAAARWPTRKGACTSSGPEESPLMMDQRTPEYPGPSHMMILESRDQ